MKTQNEIIPYEEAKYNAELNIEQFKKTGHPVYWALGFFYTQWTLDCWDEINKPAIGWRDTKNAQGKRRGDML